MHIMEQQHNLWLTLANLSKPSHSLPRFARVCLSKLWRQTLTNSGKLKHVNRQVKYDGPKPLCLIALQIPLMSTLSSNSRGVFGLCLSHTLSHSCMHFLTSMLLTWLLGMSVLCILINTSFINWANFGKLWTSIMAFCSIVYCQKNYGQMRINIGHLWCAFHSQICQCIVSFLI